MVHSGGLTAPFVASHARGFAVHIFPLASFFPFLPWTRPMAAPRSLLIGGRGGGFPVVSPAGPLAPPVLLLRRFLACPMATSSAFFLSTPAPPRSSLLPPSPIPPNTPRSRRSTPCLRRCSPQSRPSCGSLPCLCRCLTGLLGPVYRAPSPPSSSPVRSTFSSPSQYRRLSSLFRSCSTLPLRLFSLLPPSGPCSHSPRPSPLFPSPPAADIAHRDKDVIDWTGGVVSHWSVAGGSAPRGKSPSRPRTVVGDSMSHPSFLHLPQQ